MENDNSQGSDDDEERKSDLDMEDNLADNVGGMEDHGDGELESEGDEAGGINEAAERNEELEGSAKSQQPPQ